MELTRYPLFEDTLDGRRISIRFDKRAERAQAYDADGAPIAATTLYWFAWYAFHPDTAVYHAPE